MNVVFRLNKDGEYDRLLRLNELKPGDICKLRKEDGSFFKEEGLHTEHWICMEQPKIKTEDFRYGANSLPLLLVHSVICSMKEYFCENFVATDYYIMPLDLLKLCYHDCFTKAGWKTEEFSNFVDEFTSEDRKVQFEEYAMYAQPAIYRDVELYLKHKEENR